MDAYDALESEPEIRVDRSLTDSDLLIALAQVSENKHMMPGNGHIKPDLSMSLNSSLGSLGSSLNSSGLLVSKGKESTGSVPRKSARGKRKLDSSQQLSSSKKSKRWVLNVIDKESPSKQIQTILIWRAFYLNQNQIEMVCNSSL